MSKIPALACALAIVAAALIFASTPAQASYSLSMSGSTKFIGQAWTPQTFSGFVSVGLSADSQSYADVEIGCSGTIQPWIRWLDATQFRLQPGEQKTVDFNLTFPSSSPGLYSGDMYATGVPSPESGGGGASAPGMISTAMGAQVLVEAGTFLTTYLADSNGAQATITNNGNATFDGLVTFELLNLGTVLESQNQTVANLTSMTSVIKTVSWATQTALGDTYRATFNLSDANGTLVDYKEVEFYLPTPADVTQTWHDPDIVYADLSATVYAKVQTPAGTACTLHYSIDGAAGTAPMAYDAANQRYSAIISNSTYAEMDVVDYWVTAVNGAYTDTSETRSFPVFSNRAPDLEILPDEIYIVTADPANITEKTSLTVRVTVRNVGRGEAVNFILQMRVDGTVYQNKTVASLMPANRTNVDFYWMPQRGNYTVSFVADASNILIEPSEDDNYASKQVTIRPKPADTAPVVLEEDDPTTWRILVIVIVVVAVVVAILMMRWPKINVTVKQVRNVKRKDGSSAYRYVCKDTDGNELGVTRSTEVEAKKDDTLVVAVRRLLIDYDNSITWTEAKVVGKTDAAPTERAKLEKMAK